MKTNFKPKGRGQFSPRPTGRTAGAARGQVTKKPGETAGGPWEQLGVSGGGPFTQRPAPASGQAEKQRIEDLEAKDRKEAQKKIEFCQKQLKEIEEEMRQLRLQREAELRQRRQGVEPPGEDQAKKKKEAKESAVAGQSSKKKGPQGLVAGLRARARKSKAELAGGRRSG